MPSTDSTNGSSAAGFSLIELMIAMTLTLVVMGLASNFVAESLRIRVRENQRTVAISDAQRALNLMTREIANAGFNLTTNGLVVDDTDNEQIRVRSDVNFDGEVVNVGETDGEDVMFVRHVSENGRSSLIRARVSDPAEAPSVIAERIDAFTIRYYASRIAYTPQTNDADGNLICDIDDGAATEAADVADARYIILSVCVTMPEVGKPGTTNYQPASNVQLVSDISLRNIDPKHY